MSADAVSRIVDECEGNSSSNPARFRSDDDAELDLFTCQRRYHDRDLQPSERIPNRRLRLAAAVAWIVYGHEFAGPGFEPEGGHNLHVGRAREPRRWHVIRSGKSIEQPGQVAFETFDSPNDLAASGVLRRLDVRWGTAL